MKCTFYRTEGINTKEWDRIIRSLHTDLAMMEDGLASKDEIRQYLKDLLPQAEPLEKDPSLWFFGFDKPGHMPSDIRVEYFYKPTYYAAAILIQACVRYPEFLADEETCPRKIVTGVLAGCTGRGFEGSGYEAFKGLLHTMNLFLDAGVMEFREAHKDLCPVFDKKVSDTLNNLLFAFMRGPVIRDWNFDFTDQVDDLLVKAGIIPEADPEETLYYVAYGSNLNVAQMQFRCPGAKLVGTSILSGYRLVFRRSGSGFYLSIDEAQGHHVPVALWSVSLEDEKALDRYEGFPRHYRKKPAYVQIKDKHYRAFVYALPEYRPAGLPSQEYLAVCAQGYQDMHLERRALDEAVKYTKSLS